MSKGIGACAHGKTTFGNDPIGYGCMDCVKEEAQDLALEINSALEKKDKDLDACIEALKLGFIATDDHDLKYEDWWGKLSHFRDAIENLPEHIKERLKND